MSVCSCQTFETRKNNRAILKAGLENGSAAHCSSYSWTVSSHGSTQQHERHPCLNAKSIPNHGALPQLPCLSIGQYSMLVLASLTEA